MFDTAPVPEPQTDLEVGGGEETALSGRLADSGAAAAVGSASLSPNFTNREPLDLLVRKSLRRLEFSLDRHFGSRLLEQHFGRQEGRQGDEGEYGRRGMGDLSSRVLFDGKWQCAECRPHNQRREGRRLYDSLRGKRGLWLSVVASADRKQAVGVCREQGLGYVAVPVYGGQTALLSTGPLDANSEPVGDLRLVVDEIMRTRWVQHHLASCRGFLKPARVFSAWEAHHPETGRRCWHIHPDKGEARACATATGLHLDGSTRGWRVRGCSAIRSLGRVKVTGERLVQLANQAGIKHRYEIGPDTGDTDQPNRDHRTVIVLEALAWDDPRFIRLREDAGWKPPGKAGANWQPPPFNWKTRPIRITARGELVA